MGTIIDIGATRERHRIRKEARAWLLVLSTQVIAIEKLVEFFEWRRQPAHRHAYEDADREHLGSRNSRP